MSPNCLGDPNLEGFDTTYEMLAIFWDRSSCKFLNRNHSCGAYEDGRYAVWPVSVAVQAVVDAARINESFCPIVHDVVSSFGAFYHKSWHAYCASEYFPGNEDIYYDDNAQVCSALATAASVVRGRKGGVDQQLFELARDNALFLLTGEDHTRGGVRWHVHKTGRNTCTTSQCGNACLRVARLSPPAERGQYIDFARRCCDWLWAEMQDPDDKLMRDSMQDDGSIDAMKWTYNQGTPITLCALLFEATGNDMYFERARELAKAASDTNTFIFDRDTPNHDDRYYRDGLKFLQLLIEGFGDYLHSFGSRDEETSAQIVACVCRHLRYVHENLRLPNGRPQYHETTELFKLDETRHNLLKSFGEGKDLQPDSEEHVDGDVHKPFAAQLMGQASAARVFFQGARICPQVTA